LNNVKKSYLLTGLVILCWATIPSAFKISLRYLTVYQLLFFSTAVSMAAIFFIIVIQKKLPLFKQMAPRDYCQSALLGFLNPFAYYLIVFKAYDLLPAQQAQPLNMIWGVVLVLISIPVLKQRIRVLDLIAVFISFLGVLVISTEGNVSHIQVKHPLGVGLALGSSLVWAVYWVLNVRDRKDPLVRLFLNFAFAWIFALVAGLWIFNIGLPGWQGWLGAGYVGLFEMGIAYFLWLLALKLAANTASVTILIYISPFLSFVFVHLLVGERILLSSVMGAALIVLGIVINKFRELRGPGRGTGAGEV
jgi:drug/metabolite transporter (DMT)-like permease